MKLQKYIIQSIFNYPSLYYTKNYEKSRKRVLNHLFLVIGSGVNFREKYGDFSSDEKYVKTTKEDEKKILNGEKIVVIYSDFDINLFNKLKYIFPKSSSKINILFYNDLPKNKKYLECLSRDEKINIDEYDGIIETFPSGKNDYEWRPYPFSIKYSPLWNYEKDKLIDKKKILSDWLEGIIYIYTEAKKWLEDDNKFLKDKYFNWSEYPVYDPKDHFTKGWNNEPDKLKLCKDYKITPKNYTDPLEMARDIVKHRRLEHIREADRIIKHYS